MNNKFKRFNKILMMTVAILLCFVLISTSVVSGIFAKYVITRSAGATVSLKAFGLTLTVAGKTGYIDSTNKVNNTTVQAAVKLEMVPDEDINDALTVTIGGTSNVNANLKITVAATHTGFSVKNVGGIGSTAQTYVPIKFTANVNSGSEAVLLADWSTLTSGTNISKGIAGGLATALGTTTTTAVATKQICTLGSATTATPTVNTINFGFEYPDQPTTAISGLTTDEINEIQTWLGNQSTAPKITVIYTISLEQIVS